MKMVVDFTPFSFILHISQLKAGNSYFEFNYFFCRCSPTLGNNYLFIFLVFQHTISLRCELNDIVTVSMCLLGEESIRMSKTAFLL